MKSLRLTPLQKRFADLSTDKPLVIRVIDSSFIRALNTARSLYAKQARSYAASGGVIIIFRLDDSITRRMVDGLGVAAASIIDANTISL